MPFSLGVGHEPVQWSCPKGQHTGGKNAAEVATLEAAQKEVCAAGLECIARGGTSIAVDHVGGIEVKEEVFFEDQ